MLGILDIGSNTVHLLVLDPTPHARPAPLAQERSIVPIMQHLDAQGALTPEGMTLVLDGVRLALQAAETHRVDELIGMATSALREIPNGRHVLDRAAELAGTHFHVLTGAEESEFTFVAARRWAGWGAGRLLVCDIGAGSLQLALGAAELPEQAFSLPLGAGRLTHQFIADDPATPEQREALAEQVHSTLAQAATSLADRPPDRVLGTSKMLRSLGRLAGFRRHHVMEGRVLRLEQLEDWTDRLGRMELTARLQLPGMTSERAHQVFAGAVIATEMMRTLGIEELETCPWALREGMVLQYIDPLGGSSQNLD